MADKPVPKEPDDTKKNVRKLTIIDANEDATASSVVPEVAGAPPVESDDQAAISEAFAGASEEEPAGSTPQSRKIDVSEHVEESPVEESEPSEVDAPIEEENAEEPTDEAVPEEVKSDEPIAKGETTNLTETADKAAEAEPDTKLEENEASDEPETDLETAPTAPPLPTKRPLSQLTNNVPSPPIPEQDVIAEIEPEKEFADDQTAHAVDDIVATESDELLAQEDAAAEVAAEPVKKKRTLKSLIYNWWHNPAARWGTIVGLVLLIMLIVALPATRYGILNAVGVRASSNLTVTSNDSQQPLKNAQVNLAGQSGTTDDNGKVTFTKLRLGKSDLIITKRGFASVEQSHVLGWGSNPLGSIGMTVTGTRLIFTTKDFLSGKAISGAEAASGEFNAQADQNGKIILAVDQKADQDLNVTIKADGYRDENVTIKLTDSGDKIIQMVPSRPQIFVSKRSGKLDIYKIDADAKNESVILAASGKERDDMAVLPQPNGDYTAVVSTRLGARNKDGYLLSNLFIINNKTGDLTTLNESERIQLVDWSADRIVFVAVTEGASAANPNRSKLYSFQIGQPGAKQIASANYFNDATIFKGAIYYAPSSYAVPLSSVKFYKVNPDGSNQVSLLSNEVWNIFRSDYDTLQLSVQQDWYELKSGGTPTKLATAPASPKNRTYRDSPDGKRSLWVDSRDGKGVLLSYDIAAKKDTVLLSQSGLGLPLYWLNNTTIVYRINDGHETADYVISTDGGAAKKLKDVTTTDGSNYFN